MRPSWSPESRNLKYSFYSISKVKLHHWSVFEFIVSLVSRSNVNWIRICKILSFYASQKLGNASIFSLIQNSILYYTFSFFQWLIQITTSVVTSDGPTCSGFKLIRPLTTQTGRREWQCSATWSQSHTTFFRVTLTKSLVCNGILNNIYLLSC